MVGRQGGRLRWLLILWPVGVDSAGGRMTLTLGVDVELAREMVPTDKRGTREAMRTTLIAATALRVVIEVSSATPKGSTSHSQLTRMN
jgi:hypothetical protein